MGVLFERCFTSFSSHSSCSAAEAAQTSGLQVHDVHQSDEVHAILVEAVPARALRAFAIALQILLAFVVEDVVLAGHEEDVLGAGGLQQLIHGVKLTRLGEMADVAGVQDEGGRDRQRIDFVYGGLQGADNVRIRRFVEPHVAVADLDEAEVALVFMAAERKAAQAVGVEHAAFDYAKGASSRPCHALQETSAIDSVMVVVMQKFVADFGLRAFGTILFLIVSLLRYRSDVCQRC